MRGLFLFRWLLVFLLAIGVESHVVAAVDTYEFKTDDERARYRLLVEELRCPKCQNQNIADSDAPIATDLRREIFRLLNEGQSDEQIVNYLVERYGEFVRYKPPVNGRTWLLWYGPWLLLGAGLLVLAVIVWRRRPVVVAVSGATPTSSLSREERSRLSQLLNDKADRS